MYIPDASNDVSSSTPSSTAAVNLKQVDSVRVTDLPGAINTNGAVTESLVVASSFVPEVM